MVRAADLAKAQSCDDDVILDVLDDNKLHLKAVSEALFLFRWEPDRTGSFILQAPRQSLQPYRKTLLQASLA